MEECYGEHRVSLPYTERITANTIITLSFNDRERTRVRGSLHKGYSGIIKQRSSDAEKDFL